MILSLEKNFLFLSVNNTDSTSIERALRPYGQLCLTRTEFDKHLTLAEVQESYTSLVSKASGGRPFTFLVFRDPLERLGRLISSLRECELANRVGLSPVAINPRDFISDWFANNAMQARSQAKWLLGLNGACNVDYVIDFSDLRRQFAEVASLIGLDLETDILPHSIESRAGLSAEERELLHKSSTSRLTELDSIILGNFSGRHLSSADRKDMSHLINEAGLR